MDWNKKTRLSNKIVYGEDFHLIDDKYVYFSDDTCVEIDGQTITYYKLINNFDVNFPVFKYIKVVSREDGPAVVTCFKTGEIYQETYVVDNEYSRDNDLATKVEYNKNGILFRESYYKGEFGGAIYHREGGPADIFYNKNGISKESYYSYGKYHRKDGPAVVEYFENGKKEIERFYEKGSYVIDKPSILQYYENGKLESVEYSFSHSRNYYNNNSYYDKTLHREDGPALVEYYENGKMSREVHYLRGTLHNDKGIADTHFHENGIISAIYYYIHGSYSRKDGPAIIKCDVLGNIIEQKYYINNKEYSPFRYFLKTGKK